MARNFPEATTPQGNESRYFLRISTIYRTFPPDRQRKIGGDDLITYLSQHDKVLVQGSALSGKTSLAKTLAREWLRSQSIFPLLVSGAEFRRSEESSVDRTINAEIARAYGSGHVEMYRQLPPSAKVIIIDDWDGCALGHRERDTVLRQVVRYFGKVILIAGGLSYLEHLVSKLEGKDLLLEFDLVVIEEMSHVSRGKLIDKWLSLELTRDSVDFSRRVTQTERLIQSVIGRNTLPSLPFIVLSLLQASQRSGDILPENGSFGYLYEVLITSALSLTRTGSKPQLDKKYEILPLLAFRMLEASVEMVSADTLEKLIDNYVRTYMVKIDRAALVDDLLSARVLTRSEGNYSFGYDHYFYYFLARYFKNHMGGPEGATLRSQLYKIADGLNFAPNNMFLMFVIYLTHDRELIDRLIQMGSSIFAELAASDLTDEVEFYNSKSHSGISRPLPTEIDLDKSREERRRAADLTEQGQREDENAPWLDSLSGGYSSDLPLRTRLEYAHSCMEILGQILRNFTGSLPGERKLALLTTTYRLGLRTLRAVLEVLSDTNARAKEEIAKRDLQKSEDRRFVKTIERLLTIVGQVVGAATFRDISLKVGSPEIDEEAYAEALQVVGRTHATELIDLAIKLDHSESYPYNEIRDLHLKVRQNRFASNVLRDLVIANMNIFEIKREMRQRVLALFKQEPNPEMLSRSTKRLK